MRITFLSIFFLFGSVLLDYIYKKRPFLRGVVIRSF